MGISDILDKVRGHLDRKRGESRLTFRALVAEVADGREPDPARVEQVLTATGKTVDDLAGEVERLTARRALRAAIDNASTLERERSGIARKVASAEATLADAQRTFEAAVGPLRERIARIDAAEREAESARVAMRRTADPALIEEIKVRSNRAEWLASKAAQLRETIDRVSPLPDEECPRAWAPAEWDEHKRQAAARREKYRQELARVESEQSEVLEAIKRAEQSLLAP